MKLAMALLEGANRFAVAATFSALEEVELLLELEAVD
jgi:hypothetical protein